ncbi:diguanylate cyclase [Comamonas sp. CAH-2]|uniref:diguanylate cyclase n=1 Tax=Comamonas sp. CAH-2 TaxID=2605745 RepID=UPI0012AD2E4A|nr:diguanylate cyclase [Comamonas sp. CAH-2]MRT21175.1 diguanylate cyclase [Comamonas sp. CAH-2]
MVEPPPPIRSLRTQIALVFGSFSAALAMVVCFIAGEVLKTRLQNQAGTALGIVAHNAGNLLQQDLQQQIRRAQVLASSPELWEQGLDSHSISQLLQRMQHLNPYNVWIGVTDIDGQVQNATGGLLQGTNVSERPWFQEALRGPYISDVHPAVLLQNLLPRSATGEPLRVVDFVAPIYQSDSGKRLGVIGIHANWDWVQIAMDRLLQGPAKDSQQSIFIFDRAGALIYAPGGAIAPYLALGQTYPKAMAGAAPQPQLVTWNDRPQPYLTAALRLQPPSDENDLGWWIVARQPMETAYADANRVLWMALGLGLVAGLFAAWIAWRLARHVSNDLKQLAQAATHVQTTHDIDSLPLLHSNREVFQLSQALSEMTHKLLRANEEMQEQVRIRTLELQQANAELECQASTDPLTGLLNRRGFETQVQVALALAIRSGRPLSVLTLDIDFFKHINDQFGHDAGDLVLTSLAHLLRKRLRQADIVARFGGEEFVVLLPDTDGEDALRTGHSLLQTIEETPIPQVGHITASAGVSSLQAGDADGLTDMLRRADDALYQAKRTGRNRACRQD